MALSAAPQTQAKTVACETSCGATAARLEKHRKASPPALALSSFVHRCSDPCVARGDPNEHGAPRLRSSPAETSPRVQSDPSMEADGAANLSAHTVLHVARTLIRLQRPLQ